MFKNRPSALGLMVAFVLLGAMAACSKPPTTSDTQAGITPSDKTTATQVSATEHVAKPVVSASVQAMSAESLRMAAEKALNQNRIYAPRGNNAMEYYLALRDKRPDDAATASALTDLMPYTISAAEQSIAHQDFVEAKRLQAMIAKADPSASAVGHLGKAIAAGERHQVGQHRVDQSGNAKQLKRAVPAHIAKLSDKAQPAAHAVRAAAGPVDRRLLSAPSPHYPVEALRSNIGGTVIVEMTIASSGEVINARVVQSTPPRIFDRAALAAVKRWKFEATGSVSTARRKIEFDPG